MTDEHEHEDTWLYGSSNPEPPSESGTPENTDEKSDAVDDCVDGEKKCNEHSGNNIIESNDDKGKKSSSNGEKQENGQINTTDKRHGEYDNDDAPAAVTAAAAADDDDGENAEEMDDSDDDDINVVIGDIKSGSSYNIKQRTSGLNSNATGLPLDKTSKQQNGKFSIDEFECVGTISGVPAHEFSIDSLEDKPWRKPGADITDYFNYGFNEETWRAYCERQKQMRLNESGVGMQGLSVALSASQNMNRTLTPLANDSNYSQTTLTISGLIRRAGPPTGRKIIGQIDVIGSNGLSSRRELDNSTVKSGAKENVIQVMTAERREYSRPTGKFDQTPTAFPNLAESFFEQDSYNYGYEPTQEQQWVNDSGWMPSGIKELTPGPQQMIPPQMVPPPSIGAGTAPIRSTMSGAGGNISNNNVMIPSAHINTSLMMPPPVHSSDRDRGERERDRDRDVRNDRDRDRDRERDRDYRDRDRGKSEERDRDRYRERTTRRDRSRSRERRRRSKSRDKDRKKDKKKSHKKDKDDSD